MADMVQRYAVQLVSLGSVASMALCACTASSDRELAQPETAGATSANTTMTQPIATGGAGAIANASGAVAVPPVASAGASANATSTGGVAGTPNVAGAAGSMTAADGGSTAAHHDHCVHGYEPQPTDATMKDGPAEFFPPGKTDPNIVDTTLQPEVLDWMKANSWQAAHVEWHAIRGCGVAGGSGLSKVGICSFKELVPKDQNCQTAGDGYQFLVFHRHMIQALKQLWPKHTEQFTGFSKFPTTAADVPPQWRSAWKDWDAEILAAGKIGDEIDKPENLARFPDEGVLGFWLQCNVGQKLTNPANTMPFVGLHFVLHAK
jgi:hypothetical protein